MSQNKTKQKKNQKKQKKNGKWYRQDGKTTPKHLQKEWKSYSESFCGLITDDQIKFITWILSFLVTYKSMLFHVVLLRFRSAASLDMEFSSSLR